MFLIYLVVHCYIVILFSGTIFFADVYVNQLTSTFPFSFASCTPGSLSNANSFPPSSGSDGLCNVKHFRSISTGLVIFRHA